MSTKYFRETKEKIGKCKEIHGVGFETIPTKETCIVF